MASTTECAAHDVARDESIAPARNAAERVPSRRWVTLFALLCLLGVAVSAELTRIHVFTHTDPAYHSVCAVSEGVNCETVALSPYSVVAGLPVSIWGMAGYMMMGGLALSSLARRRPRVSHYPLGLLFALALFSVCVSAALAYISVTQIDSLCLFCTASYVLNVALLALSLFAYRRSGTGLISLVTGDLRVLGSRKALTTGAAVLGVAAMGGLYKAVPPYWETPGWSDLPALPSGTDENGYHYIGAKVPQITIVEFSDYECPFCRGAHRAMRALAAEHPDQVRLVHRHLPLDMTCHPGLRQPFHLRACLFARAAECAGLQGRFWEMNDALFSIQDTVKAQDVDPVELAVRLGLNRGDFKRCLNEHHVAKRIAADLEESMQRNLTGTPSFLIGERLFMGGIGKQELERLLQASSSKPSGQEESASSPGGPEW